MQGDFIFREVLKIKKKCKNDKNPKKNSYPKNLVNDHKELLKIFLNVKKSRCYLISLNTDLHCSGLKQLDNGSFVFPVLFLHRGWASYYFFRDRLCYEYKATTLANFSFSYGFHGRIVSHCPLVVTCTKPRPTVPSQYY